MGILDSPYSNRRYKLSVSLYRIEGANIDQIMSAEVEWIYTTLLVRMVFT